MKKFIFLIIAALTSGCSEQLLKRGDVNPVNLVKVSGRVVRYDCQGKVISDKTEVLQEARKMLEWRPEEEATLSSSKIYNTTTRDSGVLYGSTKFEVSLKKWDLFTTRVIEGINDFEYSFHVCEEFSEQPDPETGVHSCLKEKLWEDGEFQIDVSYEEKKHSGITEYRPSEAECAEEEGL